MMNSRDEILRAVRRQLPQSVELPPLEGDWVRYDDPVQHFMEVLKSVGGECQIVDGLDEIPKRLGELAEEGKTVVSCVPGVLDRRFSLDGIADPHELEHVDLAVLPGQLAVAENAAIWVTDAGIPHRVLFFLTQHLALIVPLSAVVETMHEAYRRIEVGTSPFGSFISGPSKTADIEQSLVKGAHGARTLQVFLVPDP